MLLLLLLLLLVVLMLVLVLVVLVVMRLGRHGGRVVLGQRPLQFRHLCGIPRGALLLKPDSLVDTALRLVLRPERALEHGCGRGEGTEGLVRGRRGSGVFLVLLNCSNERRERAAGGLRVLSSDLQVVAWENPGFAGEALA